MTTQIHAGQQIKDASIGLGKVLVSVRASTTVNGTLASAYANAQTVDGVTLATGDRILLKNQTTGAENGIYVVQASGAPLRAPDASASIKCNLFTFVEEGTANAQTGWLLATPNPIVVDTTALTFQQFTGGTPPVFVYHETPTGAIDSSNVTFTLGETPVSGSVELFLNGLFQNEGVDYTISSTTVTYAIAPLTGSTLLAHYRTA